MATRLLDEKAYAEHQAKIAAARGKIPVASPSTARAFAAPSLPLFLTLPYPPTDNHAHHGNHRLTDRTRQFRAEVAAIAVAAKCRQQTGRLVLHIEAYMPDKRRRDIGNLIKQTSDALQLAGIVVDDEQFDVVTVRRENVLKGGKLVVKIYSAGA
jgi:crossover junction endodeoxyribonuclease RusA